MFGTTGFDVARVRFHVEMNGLNNIHKPVRHKYLVFALLEEIHVLIKLVIMNKVNRLTMETRVVLVGQPFSCDFSCFGL